MFGKKIQNKSYFTRLIITSILTEKLFYFDLKWESYIFLKFEFFENRIDKKFDIKVRF